MPWRGYVEPWESVQAKYQNPLGMPLTCTVSPRPRPTRTRLSLEVVEHDAAPGAFGKADTVLPLVVEIVLIDGEERQVRLAPDQRLSGREP